MADRGNEDPVVVKTLHSINCSLAAIKDPLRHQVHLQWLLDSLKKENIDVDWRTEIQYLHDYTCNALPVTTSMKITYAQLTDLIESNINAIKRNVIAVLHDIRAEFKTLGYDMTALDVLQSPTELTVPLSNTHTKATAVHIGGIQDLEPADNPRCEACGEDLDACNFEYWWCLNQHCRLYAVPKIVSGIRPVIFSDHKEGSKETT